MGKVNVVGRQPLGGPSVFVGGPHQPPTTGLTVTLPKEERGETE
jgi:hypothetical protein